MLFLCDIFNTNSSKILNKNQFICPKIHNCSIFIHYLASILKLCTILAQLCHLEEIVRKLAYNCKNHHICFHGNHGSDIGVRLFQLLILEGY